ncbi:MAG: putative phosphothreonine lyase domain-containing protein [Bacteroidota bacterium]
MDRDDRRPSEVTDSYWIYASNERNNYQVKRGESGKWLIFEHRSKLDELWAIVRKATRAGKLGGSAKTSTAKPNPNASDPDYKVICVYTADLNNREDVNRVANALRALNVNNKLVYKLDRDVGRYEKQGHKNLSQQVNYSEAYFEMLSWLVNNPNHKHSHFLGTDKSGRKRFQFRQLDMSKEKFELRIQHLKRLGFRALKRGSHDGEFVFTE